jgi:hypothetical protein
MKSTFHRSRNAAPGFPRSEELPPLVALGFEPASGCEPRYHSLGERDLDSSNSAWFTRAKDIWNTRLLSRSHNNCAALDRTTEQPGELDVRCETVGHT